MAEGSTLDAANSTVDAACVLFAEAASRREWLTVCGERLSSTLRPHRGRESYGLVAFANAQAAVPGRVAVV